MVACGYKVDMPYLCEFLNRGDVSNYFAVLKLEFWYHDLPPQQRASFPCPCTFASSLIFSCSFINKNFFFLNQLQVAMSVRTELKKNLYRSSARALKCYDK